MYRRHFFLLTAFWSSVALKAADFREYPIGEPVEKNYLRISAVYFPAVPMDEAGMGHNHGNMATSAEIAKEKFAKPGKELIHLEADIHSLKDNPTGFGVGEWIPYLKVQYKIIDASTHKALREGELMPMIAKDGPHYGTTLRMPGKGQYELDYVISAPALARHTDPLTGVAEYWKTFEVVYAFKYEGVARP